MPLLKKKTSKYTYQDYLNWDDGERWEIIEGEAYNMSPAPTSIHQRIAGICYRQLDVQLAGRKCIPFIAPTDVVLSEDNVVQPDIFVVCQKKKITSTHIEGAPDLVIEILSPSTALKDRREKKQVYERYHVQEYILIHPDESYAERYLLKNNFYQSAEIFGEQETIKLKSLKGIKLNLKEIFESKKIFK